MITINGFILFNVLVMVVFLLLEYIYIRFFDDQDIKSKDYITLALASIIPIANTILLVGVAFFIIRRIIILIMGPGFKHIVFKLDNYRTRNRDIKIRRRLDLEDEYELLKMHLVDAGLFRNKYEIRDFLQGLKVANKLIEK